MEPTRQSPGSCPQCGELSTEWLEYTSHCNKTEAYRCHVCGHVWQVPFEGTAEEAHDRLMHRTGEPDDPGAADK